MKYGEVKRQLQAQNFLSAAAQETLLQSNAELQTQQHIANIAFSNSLAVAGETLQQLKSSQYAFNAMQSRYNNGLVSLSDVVQVQYNLLQAELAVRIAHWDAWKALLLQAFVQGNVNVFLNEVK
jgi:outer membrane protein TolC